jgi:hypothetical protein
VFLRVTAVMAGRKHPVTFRTRKLSFPAPMVLHSGGCGRVGHRRTIFRMTRKAPRHAWGLSCVHHQIHTTRPHHQVHTTRPHHQVHSTGPQRRFTPPGQATAPHHPPAPDSCPAPHQTDENRQTGPGDRTGPPHSAGRGVQDQTRHKIWRPRPKPRLRVWRPRPRPCLWAWPSAAARSPPRSHVRAGQTAPRSYLPGQIARVVSRSGPAKSPRPFAFRPSLALRSWFRPDHPRVLPHGRPDRPRGPAGSPAFRAGLASRPGRGARLQPPGLTHRAGRTISEVSRSEPDRTRLALRASWIVSGSERSRLRAAAAAYP